LVARRQARALESSPNSRAGFDPTGTNNKGGPLDMTEPLRGDNGGRKVAGEVADRLGLVPLCAILAHVKEFAH
jgi:hypothetical protein